MASAAQPERVHGRAARWGAYLRALAALLVHPDLWVTALRQAALLAGTGWWRRPPFLPLPDRGYLRFRIETAYGDDGLPESGDLVAYLRWCRERRR